MIWTLGMAPLWRQECRKAIGRKSAALHEVARSLPQTSGMAAKSSAGILLFRRSGTDVEVLLGHMGGPFWSRRDAGGWSVPKGELEPDEEPEAAARREFAEELGLPVPNGELLELGDVRQRNGKVVTAWALEGELDPNAVVPGTFEMQWPKGSGRMQQFPEIDQVAWLTIEAARDKIVQAQQAFLDRLVEMLDA